MAGSEGEGCNFVHINLTISRMSSVSRLYRERRYCYSMRVVINEMDTMLHILKLHMHYFMGPSREHELIISYKRTVFSSNLFVNESFFK